MAEEEYLDSELSDRQKKEIAKWFLLNSPAVEIQFVSKDLRPAADEELLSPYIEEFCCTLDAEILKYVGEAYPKGICSVYCVNGKDVEGPGSNFELVVVISAVRNSPKNFCNGSWRSVWNIEFRDDVQMLGIRGKIQATDDSAFSIANIIRYHEAEYLASLEVINVSLFTVKYLNFGVPTLTVMFDRHPIQICHIPLSRKEICGTSHKHFLDPFSGYVGGAQEWRNFNGHLVNCDTWMNIHLPVVICTSKVIDKVQEETKSHSGMVSGYILFITAEIKQLPVRTRMATAMVEESNFEDDQLASMTTEDILRASRLLDNEIRILKEELQRTNLELDSYKEKIKENQEKIKLNKQLPYLVGNIVEILEMNPEDEAEEDGANVDLDSQRKGKCVVLKTSTRQTIFLPVVGLVDPDKLKPGDLVGVNKDSYLILDTLPSEYDSRVKAMEVDEKPTEDYNDIGGLEKQIQELVEAIVLPMTHKERFQKLVSGSREVQRTMLELLNQLDGFSSDERIKVIAATNRADILDPALMRSGRLDRKIEFPHPSEEARARILQIHSRKMNVHPDVNFEELARSTDDFNGAQLKAVCVEAGMLALRRDATEVLSLSLSLSPLTHTHARARAHKLACIHLVSYLIGAN
ncbi:hypothetical protein GH714_025951 [Hevea brasiliensis]|uniref:Uncharacterized protein n=2 Tax=Magnoliopsida TaxID=3398 RepID=A0A6A6M382_HEVBR|nr:hypothetical protein GH714_025951 [Hevea brasiliensis]